MSDMFDSEDQGLDLYREPTNREVLNALRWKKFPVPGQGFVALVDAMGDDEAIVEAARTSYGADTKQMSDSETLLRYLSRHRHGTPFEMAEVKILVMCPMDTWRQWIRHRTANVNEYSTRYKPAIDLAVRAETWRAQAGANKQGSAGTVTEWPDNYVVLPIDAAGVPHMDYFEPGRALDYDAKWQRWGVFAGAKCLLDDSGTAAEDALVLRWAYDGARAAVTPARYLSDRESEFHASSSGLYAERLEFNVAREQARKDLPLSTYTRAYWKCDLRNIFGFLGLRMDSHAQLEIRQYANVIGNEIIAKLFPQSWQAFLDYELNSMRLSACDIAMLQTLAQLVARHAVPYLPQALASNEAFAEYLSGWRDEVIRETVALGAPLDWFTKPRCRERDEFVAKVQRLQLFK